MRSRLISFLNDVKDKFQDGETVKVGQAIAKVGNSDNTSEPHLHIHARRENTGQSLLEGEGLN
ncbi:M23 family metallopeptidase [Oscillatoria sp. FACHB-1407]|nr:M23 family metallopeptidase [Oscillatoria sp. FACHB-1407]